MAIERQGSSDGFRPEEIEKSGATADASLSAGTPDPAEQKGQFSENDSESKTSPNLAQAAQQKPLEPSPLISPDSTPMDAEAKALLEASYRIGAASNAEEYHSYSSLLVACMLADNPASRWFRRRLKELKVDPTAQKGKLGLSEADLEGLARGISALPTQTKTDDWTPSATNWLAFAWSNAQRRGDPSQPEIAARDLIAAFVFARNFHKDDRSDMGLGPANEGAADRGVELANGFMSFILVHHADEYPTWSAIFKDEFGVDPAPDIAEGPATRLSSDRWTTDDRLGYRGYARAIRHFLLHPSSKPPLSISIQAPWGAGKTSLMRMVQEELDPEAVKAARAGGWKALQAKDAKSQALGLGDFLKIIGGARVSAPSKAKDGPKRYTVWFNAWKYESGNQLWAGLATAIIDQLTARMAPLEREDFLLRLQASRIDPARVRARIYDLALSMTLTGLRDIGLWARSAIPLGATVLFGGAWVPAGVVGSLLWAAGEVFVLFGKKKDDAEKEPVSVALGDIVSVPDYDSEVGFTHRVVEDLQRVFEALRGMVTVVMEKSAPEAETKREAADSAWPPIVVFVDDLDRCSPSKVADVIEGVNMFLAGDFMPCVFVIGMDPQMVSAALEKAHQDITTQLPGYDRQTPLGWRFMDKFVQLPFTIPPPGADKLGEYTDHLLHGAEVEEIVEECEEEVEKLAKSAKSAKEGRAEVERVAASVAGRRNLEQPAAKAVERVLHNSFALRLQDRLSENFSDSQPVVQEMLREAAQGFSRNPRDIKRLLNVVRFEYLLSRTRVAADQPIPDAETMGRWIALSLRWPAFVRWLQWSPQPIPGRADQAPSGGIVRHRLQTIERLCREESDFDAWREKVREALQLREGDVQWDADRNLRDFLADATGKPLSAGAGLGFY